MVGGKKLKSRQILSLMKHTHTPTQTHTHTHTSQRCRQTDGRDGRTWVTGEGRGLQPL